MRTIGLLGVLVFALISTVSTSWAFPGFLKIFKETYSVSADSTLGKANCAICHTSSNKGDAMNPYGADLKKVLQAKHTMKMTPEILASIESLDSDQDGVANIDEIKADTLPGNPNSYVLPKEWKVPAVAPLADVDAVPGAVKSVLVRVAHEDHTRLGDVRIALAGDNLAFSAKVLDRRITAKSTTWSDTGFDIAIAPTGSATFRRLVYSPKSATGGDIQLYQNADKLAAPELKLKIIMLPEYGYEVNGLIPLSALQLDPKAESFQFEFSVLAAPTAEAKPRFASVFGTPAGYPNDAKFGKVMVVK